ncbi:MAG: hypothetical protein K9M01_02945 [Candidatus Omnitrophica bacterium]|nr:hypothetical protein [Candidatus Omnitrophota bacterium]MCF7917158.1 hypothetical protein [Candidatus Omnitrophota bacterium]
MPPSKESQKIAGDFARYARTGDKSIIKKYKTKELEIALIQYSADKRFPHYSAMERRVNELKEIEKAKKSNKEKWKDRIIGFFFGIIISVISGFLLYLLTKK